MLVVIKILKKIFAVLHSNASPMQISLGVVFGAFLGLAPFLCLHKLAILLCVIFFNVNIGSAFLSVLIFSVVGMPIDSLSHKIGYFLLVESKSLNAFWTDLYNMPIIPFTRFYNTVVLGGFVVALIIAAPVYFASKKFVFFYRKNLAAKVEKWKIIKIFKLSNFYNMYSNYSG